MWNRETFAALVAPPVIGMVHLLPLPDAPDWGGDLSAVEEAALRDADALAAGGVGAIMVENYHDTPFHPETVPPVTVAALTMLVGSVRRRHPAIPIGVNVLRNDAASAIAIASVTGANFVRVNVHVGAVVTDQGLVQGRAHETLRLRRAIAPGVAILADARVKHAAPLAERPLADELGDLRGRGRADAVILSGAATGSAGDPRELRTAREARPGCPLLVGSGMSVANVAEFAPWADGFIVGTSLQTVDETGRRAVDEDKVREFLAAVRAAGPQPRTDS